FLPHDISGALREIERRLRSGEYKLLHLAGWGNPVLLGSMLLAKARRVPIVVETDTPPPVNERAWRRWAKRLLYPPMFSLPKMFLPAGTPQAAYLEQYGVRVDRIQKAKMTVDVDAIAKYAANFDADSRSAFRKRVCIQSAATVFLYVGRLETQKGVHELLDAYIRLRAERSDVALVIVGGGTLEPLVSSVAASIRSVFYLGRLNDEQVWDAYCAADVFV